MLVCYRVKDMKYGTFIKGKVVEGLNVLSEKYDIQKWPLQVLSLSFG